MPLKQNTVRCTPSVTRGEQVPSGGRDLLHLADAAQDWALKWAPAARRSLLPRLTEGLRCVAV